MALIIFGALYSLLLGVSQGSVLNCRTLTITVYFYKLSLGWKVVSLALIPHFPISIDHWFSSLNGFTLVTFGALYSLLFGESPCRHGVEDRTLTYNGLLLQITTYMNRRLFSLAVIPHLLIY